MANTFTQPEQDRVKALNEEIKLTFLQRLLLDRVPTKPNICELKKFREYIALRSLDWEKNSDKWEKALDFVDKINTRFLNKARGLVTVNGLTLAAFSALLIKPGIQTTWITVFGIAFAVLSTFFMLWTHFLVNWGKVEEYASDKAEFESYIPEIAAKAKWIGIAGILSIFSILALGWGVIFTLLN
jgi:hypothetical protein